MEQKLALIQQQDCGQLVTILQGEAPVIELSSVTGGAEAIMAINFLRSGCPTVQLYDVDKTHNLPSYEEKVTGHFEKIKLAGEHFNLHGDGELITVTRTLEKS